MTIGKRKFTHLVSKNKKIRIWHRCLSYTSNAYIVKTSKLVNNINLDRNKYNAIEVFINSNIEDKNNSNIEDKNNIINLDNSFNLDFSSTARDFVANVAITKQKTLSSSNILDFGQLCGLCVKSKLISIVICHKLMTPIKKKLEEIYADLWRLYNLAL